MKVYSYDLFDTCLIRACGRPEYIFDILADRVLGNNADIVTKMDFAQERIQAEKKARKGIIDEECEEITLDELYDFCDFSQFTDYSISEIKEIELQIEAELLYPVDSIREEIQELHSKGQRVLYISDMYLPCSFIMKVLFTHQLFEEGDELFLSSEIKKTKATGNLYRYICKEKQIRYNKWYHQGDNAVSDYKVPRKLGIHCKKISHKYSIYESKLSFRNNTSTVPNVKIMASISRCVRLQHPNSAYVSFATDFIAPILVPFVHSILLDAKKRGIKHLYFLARDGYILYEISKVLVKELQDDSISLNYLFASRKSLYLPGLEDISPLSILKMFQFPNEIDIDDLLDVLQIENCPDNIKNKYKGLTSLDLINQVLSENWLKEKIENNRTNQRRLALQYFKEQGLGRDQCAIVDLTGTLKCHKAINNILKEEGLPKVFGYYFEVLGDRIQSKDYFAINFQERYKYDRFNFSLIPHGIMEQYFCVTTQSRTKKYQQTGNHVLPIYESDKTDESYKRIVSEVNISVCRDFARIYSKTVKTAHPEELSRAATTIYSNFLLAPRKEFLKTLEELYFSESAIKQKKLLRKRPLLPLLVKKDSLWFSGDIIYNSIFPNLTSSFLESYYKYRFG